MNSVNHKQMDLFPPSDIDRWKAELRQVNEELRKIDAQRDVLESRRGQWKVLIAAAEGLSSTSATIEPPLIAPAAEVPSGVAVGARKRGPKPGRQLKAVSWTRAIEEIVSRNPKGITNASLRKEYADSTFPKKLGNSEKSFYGAIAKLLDKKIIVRHKGHLFKPAALESFLNDVSKGIVADVEAPKPNGQKSPFGDAIKPFLESRPGGATSSEIAAELRNFPEFLDTLERHRTHFYNVLARLVETGEVLKGGGKYFRNPSKSQAASNLPEQN